MDLSSTTTEIVYMTPSSITVVIPCYNGYAMTNSLLLDIYKLFPKDTQVVVVDDCSTDVEVLDGLKWWKKNMFVGRMEIYSNEENLGFLRTANYGVSQAKTDIVCLISNDVKIYESPVKEILDTFETVEVPLLMGKTLYSHTTGWNTFDGIIFPYIDGSFLAFRKKEWENFGGFDERYIPFDFEDVDISTHYMKSGGHLQVFQANVVHLGAQTNRYSPEREAQTKRNQEKFRQIWTGK